MKSLRVNLLVMLGAALVAAGVAASAVAAPSQPNIIFFVADDLGAYDTAFAGSEFYLTPNIDRLASEGVVFSQAYAAHPRCVPSRYALMTGRYPARAGSPGKYYGIERDRTTVAEALRAGGYATFFLGKWHLASGDSGNPDEHGFDVNIAGGPAGSPGSYEWPYKNKKNSHHKAEKEIKGLEDGHPGEMLTDRLTAEAEKLIRGHEAKNPGQPFFLMLSHYGVHTPFEDTKDRVKMFRQRLRQEVGEIEGPEFAEKDGTTRLHQDNPTYAAMIFRVDESLGRLVALVEELGLDDNTVIVFTSDHGGLSNRGVDNKRALATTNAPLRAGKGHLFEGGVRVPLIVKWPGHVAPGSTSAVKTIGTDHFPTFLDMAGLAMLPDSHQDGQSILPAITGGVQPERGPMFWHSPRARPNSTGDHNASAIRDGDYKLIHWYDDNRDELFNIAADPAEATDLCVQKPGVAESMRAKLDAWLRSVDAVEPHHRVKKTSKKAVARNFIQST